MHGTRSVKPSAGDYNTDAVPTKPMTANKEMNAADEKAPTDTDRWQYENTADGILHLETSFGGADAEIDDSRGCIKTYPLQSDGQVPVAVIAEGGEQETESHLWATIQLDPDQAEAFASDLVDQAAAAREQREELADE